MNPNLRDDGGVPDGDRNAGAPEQGDRFTALEQRMERRFQRMERRLEEIADRLDALGVDRNNRNRDDRGLLRDRAARGGRAGRHIPARREPNFLEELKEEEEEAEIEEEFEYREDRRNRNEYRLKIDIPYFYGNLNIEDFLDWIADIDRFFDYMEVPPEKRVKVVACRLRAGASAWWDKEQRKRQREGHGPVRTWFRMRALLIQQFLPPDYDQILFQQYQRCQQGNRSVYDYTAEFMRLSERSDLRESNGQQVQRFVDGLKPMIKDRIGVQHIRTLAEAKNLALKAEMMQLERARRNSD